MDENQITAKLYTNPNAILDYNGDDEDIFRLAIERGFKLKKKHLEGSHPHLKQSYTMALHAISINPKYIKYFYCYGKMDELFRLAIEKGATFNYFDLISHANFLITPSIMQYFLESNPSYIKLYIGSSENVFEKALELGYKPSIRDLKKHENFRKSSCFAISLMKENVNNFKLYTGDDTAVFQFALDSGYTPTVEDLDNTYLRFYDPFMKKLLETDPKAIELYLGSNEQIFEFAFNHGYNLDQLIEYISNKMENDKAHLLNICRSSFIMKKLIDRDPSLFKYYFIDKFKVDSSNFDINIDIDLVQYAISKGFKPDLDFIERFEYDYAVLIALVSGDPSNIELVSSVVQKRLGQPQYDGFRQLYLSMMEHGYIPSIKEIEHFENQYQSILTKEMLDNNIDLINLYKGSDEDLYAYAFKKGFKPSDDIVRSRRVINSSQRLLYFVTLYDKSIVLDNNFLYTDSYLNRICNLEEYDGTLKCITRREFLPTKDEEKAVFFEMIQNSTEEQCIELINKLHPSEEIIQYISENKLNNMPTFVLRDISYYKYDGKKLIQNYELLKNFLSFFNINSDLFLQYALSNSFDFLSEILEITNGNQIDYFASLYHFIENKYFENVGLVYSVNNLINTLKFYKEYPELASELLQKPSLSKDEQINLTILLNSKQDENNLIKVSSLNDLNNIQDKLKLEFGKSLVEFKTRTTFTTDDLEEIKNQICTTLFGMNYTEVYKLLKIYGGRIGLRQLIFENSNNSELVDRIFDIMPIISFIEDVYNIENIDQLINLAENIYANYDLVNDCKSVYLLLNEKMKHLYEDELVSNLTTLDFEKDLTQLIDQEKTSKYGVETIDLSDKKYCLLFHTKSQAETVEELINGISSGKQNTICMSIGSHRNIVLYSSLGRIIFATDDIPENSFIRSSTTNMGSNGTIQNYNSKDSGELSLRTQKGALSTSISPNGNSEVLAFRDGIKFKYIVLPGGREPFDYEIEIAKEYGLKFVVTQEQGKRIDNPEDIDENLLVDKTINSGKKAINISQQLDSIKLKKDTGPRKIAILTDAHGLFEPTLAILEDARKRGISEIYSLGDNIGTGPNPSEVMELLDEYGVQSIMGNHEEYVLSGVDAFKEHLSGGALEEARRGTSWTKSQLKPEQLEEISKLPKEMLLDVGDKLVYLTHYLRDYNTGQQKEIPEGVDSIIQGHIHRESEYDKVTTLRGAGIGYYPSASSGYVAKYCIITENPDGTYEKEYVEVPFNYRSLMHDINESSMDLEDKKKINDWAGVSR